MSSGESELLRFAASNFTSVWALELLLLLKSQPRKWSHAELIASLRASDLVVSRSLDALVVAGLVSEEADGAVYMPVDTLVEDCVDQLHQLYLSRPNAVRRAIVSAGTSGAAAFANAFKLGKD